MNTHSLLDRNIVVTGGAGGIGMACAAHFLGRGSRVTLVDVDAVRLEQAAITVNSTKVIA